MDARIIKEKWHIEYILLQGDVPIAFEVDARGPMDARKCGERVMQKEWGKRGFSWHFVGVKKVDKSEE